MLVRSDSVTVPGRERDLTRLLERCGALADNRRGELLFIAGDEASGRSALLKAFAGHAPVRVVAGAFHDGVYEPEVADTVARSRILAVIKHLAAIAGHAHPIAALIAQVVAESRSAWDSWIEFTSSHAEVHAVELATKILRRAALEGPVVCLIDDADSADGGWWDELIMSFAVEICDDLPLLLALSVQGPAELGAPTEGEPPSQSVARILSSKDLATWHWLGAVSVEDLSRWVGPSDMTVIRHLDDAAGGASELAAQIWRAWVAEGVVARRVSDDRWAFTENGRDRALAPVRWVLARRIRRLVGDAGVASLDWAQEVLTCAALEGRDFTADAVAAALDRPDALALIESATKSEESILRELPTVTITDEAGRRELRRYRFTTKLDWLVLRRYGVSAERRRALSLDLMAALATAWGADQNRVAGTLARLCRDAGESEKAATWERIRNVGGDRAALVWRAEQLLQRPRPVDSFSRNRAAEVLIGAASAVYDLGPYADGLRYARGAKRTADILRYEATGSYYAAWFYGRLGHRDAERLCLNEALEGYRAVGDEDGVVNTTHQLANLDFALENLDAARDLYLQVLASRQKRGDRLGEATALQALGDVHLESQDRHAARRHYMAALDLTRALNAPKDEATNLYRLARLDAEEGSLQEAELSLRRALAIQRAVGDRRNEAATVGFLASVLRDRGKAAEARAAYAAAVAREIELGDGAAEATYRYSLADLDSADGRDGAAREGYLTVLRLYRELRDADGETAVLVDLAELDYRCGNAEAARTTFVRLRDLARRRSDRSAVCQALCALARIDAEGGELDRARAESLESLTVARGAGERSLESLSLFLLAKINRAEGRIADARSIAEQALAIDIELSDQAGEEVIRDFLRELTDEE